MSTPQSNKWRGPLIEAGVAIVMILLAFIAIAASDVSASGSFHYWLGLIGLYALISLVSQHYFQYKTLAHTSNALALLLHWAGVLAAVLMIFFFVSTGRITNADTGLTNRGDPRAWDLYRRGAGQLAADGRRRDAGGGDGERGSGRGIPLDPLRTGAAGHGGVAGRHPLEPRPGTGPSHRIGPPL